MDFLLQATYSLSRPPPSLWQDAAKPHAIEYHCTASPQPWAHSTRTSALLSAFLASNKSVAFGLFGSTMRRRTHLTQPMLTLLLPRQQNNQTASHHHANKIRHRPPHADTRAKKERRMMGWKPCTEITKSLEGWEHLTKVRRRRNHPVHRALVLARASAT